MVFPNIDISSVLEFAWAFLQWTFRWGWVLALIVFLMTLWAGAGDILGEILRKKKPPREETISRVKE
jgi:hypothetical protein